MMRYLFHKLGFHSFTVWRRRVSQTEYRTIYDRHCIVCGKKELFVIPDCLLAPKGALAWWLKVISIAGGGILLLACAYTIYKLTHTSS